MVLSARSNTDGSFISFQKPATPMPTKYLYCSPHQSLAFVSVKSGNTLGPGHTGPTKTLPSGFLTKTSRCIPVAYDVQAGFGSFLMCRSVISTLRTRGERKSESIFSNVGKYCRFTVNGAYPCW